jgi:hypothetical protein
MNQFTLKEQKAIELRYLGKTIKEIAEHIDTPEKTVWGWFSASGKLYEKYNLYTEELNKKRHKKFEENITISDEEFFVVTTNVLRNFGKSLQPRKVPLVNKRGEAVADEFGNPKMVVIESEHKFSVSDLKIVWQMQRVMQGLPTSYERQEISETTLREDEVIEKMGLEPEDFLEENYDNTMLRIFKYIKEREGDVVNS